MTEMERAERKARRFWVAFIVALLGAPVVFNFAIVAVVAGDETFAIEPDYHAKGLAWDAELEQRRTNERLGWRTGVTMTPAGGSTRIEVSVVGADGRAITGATVAVEAFPIARGDRRHDIILGRMAPGHHAGLLPATRPGLWEVRVEALVGDVRFTDVARVDVEGVARIDVEGVARIDVEGVARKASESAP